MGMPKTRGCPYDLYIALNDKRLVSIPYCNITSWLAIVLGPVPERPISANPGLKFCSTFCIYLLMHCLKQHFVLSFIFFEVKAQQNFVSSRNVFLEEKTLLKIGFILG